jgi:hypothetical protein
LYLNKNRRVRTRGVFNFKPAFVTLFTNWQQLLLSHHRKNIGIRQKNRYPKINLADSKTVVENE